MASYDRIMNDQALVVKQEEKTRTPIKPYKSIKAELLFLIYMILINICSLMYPIIFISTSVVDSQFYSLKQNLTNYIYNFLCIIMTILSIINLKASEEVQKEKCTLVNFFTQCFFVAKINIDIFNLIKMTPESFIFSKQMELLFTYVMTFNTSIYYSIMSNKLTNIKFSHKISIIAMISGLSIARCFLFYESEKYPNNSQKEITGLIINETSKIFYYFFIFIIMSKECEEKKFKKEDNEDSKIKKSYEDMFSILYSTVDNCQCRGFIVLSRGQKIFTSHSYFKQLFSNLIKRREGSVNRSAKSQFKKSINVPSLKLSNIDVVNNSDLNKLTDINIALKKLEPHNTTKQMSDKAKEEKRKNSIGSSNFGSLPKKTFSANNLGMSINYQLNPKLNIRSSINVNDVKNHLGLPNIDEENDENSVFRTASLNRSKKISEDKVKSPIFLSNKSNIFADEVAKTSSKNSRALSNEKRKTLPNPTSSVLKILEEKSRESPTVEKKETSSSEVSSSDSDSDTEEIQLINSDILDIFKSNSKQNSIVKSNKRKSISNTLTSDLKGLKNLHNFPDCTIQEGHYSEIRKISKKNNQLSELTIDPKKRIFKYPILKNLQDKLQVKKRDPFQNSLQLDKNKNNIVVNNNYNINIINSTDAINFKDSSKFASKSLKHDHFINSLNNSNSKISNTNRIIASHDNQVGEIFNTNFLNGNSPTLGYNNVNFIITFTNTPNFTPDYNNNDFLKEQITNYNKSLGYGLYFSDFINKISEILKSVNETNINIEFGPYFLTIPDMSYNIDDSLIFQNNLIYFTVVVKRTYRNDEPIDFIILKSNNKQKPKKLSHQKFSNKKISNPNSYLNPNSLNKNLSVPNENDFIGGGFMSQSSNSVSHPKIRTSNSHFNTDNSMFKAKISALLHDFKHVVIDNHLFYEQLMQKYKIALEEEDSLYMNVMEDYLNSLIFNLTNFMKDSDNFFKGSSSENNQPVDLAHLVDIMVTVFNRRLKWENESIQNVSLNEPQLKRNLKIHYKIIDENNSAGKIVQSNKNLLMSLIYNLMSNAYKYTKEGEIKVELTTINYGKKVMLKIVDTGSGIPDYVLKSWNKPFNLGTENQQKNAKSTGLGGYIMASIAKNLKLEMPLPEPNPLKQGTVIKVFIPVNTVNNGNMLVTSNSNSHSEKSFATRILSSERAFFINYNEKNFVNYKETNMSDSLGNAKKTINILCLDDDSIVINSLVIKVQSLLKSSKQTNIYEFKFDICNNFKSFYDKLSNINNGKHYNFFILDQNISLEIKGVDIAEMTNKIYKFLFEDSYNKILLEFIFVTEQAESLKDYFEQKFNPIYKEENVFGKRDHEAIVKKIGLIVNEFYNF